MTSGDAMEMAYLRPAAASAQVYLRDVSYPATRQMLIDHAKAAGAPEGVIEVLDRLPDPEYRDSVELQKALDEVVRLPYNFPEP